MTSRTGPVREGADEKGKLFVEAGDMNFQIDVQLLVFFDFTVETVSELNSSIAYSACRSMPRRQ